MEAGLRSLPCAGEPQTLVGDRHFLLYGNRAGGASEALVRQWGLWNQPRRSRGRESNKNSNKNSRSRSKCPDCRSDREPKALFPTLTPARSGLLSHSPFTEVAVEAQRG